MITKSPKSLSAKYSFGKKVSAGKVKANMKVKSYGKRPKTK